MKRKNCIIISLILLVIVIGNLVGCSNEAATDEDSFEELKARGEIIMGLDDTFAPMGFRDDEGELVGFDVDLAEEVFSRTDFEVKLQPIDWTMKEAELNSGNIDLIWNGYSITDERKEKVAFTQPYLENRQVVVTLLDSEIDSKADLEGKKVAVQSESSALEAVNSEPEVVATFDGGEPVLFDTYQEAMMDLEAGRVDAVVGDEVLIRYYIKQKGSDVYKVIGEDFGEEEYGIGVRKSDKKLLELLNNILDEMREDGTYDEIYERWFEGE
ncbi:MAG TPA: amino acid ABC transporter substrate-binding protein [Tepidimicrobium sp.]|nr:amino acid ABC transporter substrate-binding protein [Tepidimicrobium sp.]